MKGFDSDAARAKVSKVLSIVRWALRESALKESEVMAGLAEAMVCGVVRAESYDRAKKFYTQVLGLGLAQEIPGANPGGLFTAGKGTMLMVYQNPKLKAPENTTLGFGVAAERFDALISELRANGVVLEDYDIPEMGLKTEGGIAEMDGQKSAWFKDTEGNILNVVVM
jgi:predicted enzyme related to lactoylglutathione lyase